MLVALSEADHALLESIVPYQPPVQIDADGRISLIPNALLLMDAAARHQVAESAVEALRPPQP